MNYLIVRSFFVLIFTIACTTRTNFNWICKK